MVEKDLGEAEPLTAEMRNAEANGHKRAPTPSSKMAEAPKHAAFLSCLAYTFCSITMVLANKGLASGYPKGVDFITIALQSVIAVVLVLACDGLGWIQLGTRFEKEIALKWLPVNSFFVAMLFTGFLSLVYLNVPMVTIFKNLTNVVIMTGEWRLYGQPITLGAAGSCGVMILGAILAAANDITFNAAGYFWMLSNCLCTAGYVLYMKHATKTIKISKFGMVLYNNLLSIPILLTGALCRGEFQIFLSEPSFHTSGYLLLSLYAGLVGFFLNTATLWCVSNNSATTYAVVGALNKIPTVIIGWLLFKAPMTSNTITFICVSMVGGFMYTASKLQEAKQAQADKLPK